MIPDCAPCEAVDLKAIKDGSIWKSGEEGIVFFARWTLNFDCGYETDFWYTVLDHPFDLKCIKAKHRYQIKQGLKNFEVKEINFNSHKKSLPVLLNKIRMQEYESYVDFTSLKVLPEYEKKSVNEAIVYAIVERYKNKLGDIYISNGSRSVHHPSNFNEYLIRMFEFRKAYCKLVIVYRWWLKPVITILFPFRNKIAMLGTKQHVFQMISGVLKMKEIARSFRRGTNETN